MTRLTGLGAAALAALDIGVYARLLQVGGTSRTPSLPLVLLLAAIAVAAGLGALVQAPLTRRTLLGGAAGAALLTGVVGIFSIGLPLFGAGVLALFAIASTPAGPAPRRAAIAPAVGATLGLAAVAAVFVPTMFPSVTCHSDGAEADSGWGFFGGGSSETGSESGSGGKDVTGSFTAGGHTYDYACQGNRLTLFRRR